MDARPKSNRLKRQENRDRLRRKAERRGQAEARVAAGAGAWVALAEKALKEAKALGRDPEALLHKVMKGEPVRVPATSDLRVIADLLRRATSNGLPARPNLPTLRRLVLFCRERTDLLIGREAGRYADALLALSAHAGRWVRALDDWRPRSHNAYRQFHSLVRHLTARYDVPTFLNTAWLEGLTPDGLLHQHWFLHVAGGQNLRTADGLPVPLTKRQAHLYMQAPDDFDALSAFRWAQIHDLGGGERLARSVLATRVGTRFEHEEFWQGVFRWLVAHPLLDPAHHGPIIDYVYAQRFAATEPDPTGAPRLVPPQPNLSMKRREPAALLRAVDAWHRRLGHDRDGRLVQWGPSGLPAFRHEEGQGESRKVYTVNELLTSRELGEEGRRMGHCVGSYTASCAARRVSIWTLRVADPWGREERLLTLEVTVQARQVAQARGKYNRMPTAREVSVLRRWAESGGPALSKWVAGV